MTTLTRSHTAARALTDQLLELVSSGALSVCEHAIHEQPVRPWWTPGLDRLLCQEEFTEHLPTTRPLEQCQACTITGASGLQLVSYALVPVHVLARVCNICAVETDPATTVDEDAVTTALIEHILGQPW